MQHEIQNPAPLLNDDGSLYEAGYAKYPILVYDRSQIKAGRLRIKEWDYYLIQNDRYAVALTCDDNSYMSSEYGDAVYSSRRVKLSFTHEDGARRLKVVFKRVLKKQDFECDFVLTDEPRDSMVIATPFEKDKKAFYYNQKIIAMRASGTVWHNGKKYKFTPGNSFGLLDWGRGVWTYDNTWYWSAAQGTVNGKRFGFNLGYGFGDTSAASENMLFTDGAAHKLEQVRFEIPLDEKGKERYTDPWRFTSSDGRLELDFVPIIDRKNKTSLGIIMSDQHQVFGRFSGKVILDGGEELVIENLLGFAEKVRNKW